MCVVDACWNFCWSTCHEENLQFGGIKILLLLKEKDKREREREREVSCHQLSSVKKGEKVLLKSDLRHLREMSSFSSLSHKRSDAKKQIQTVLTCPVWPDWDIFERSRQQTLLIKVAQFFGFFAKWLLWLLWTYLGYFLFQHLVTLPTPSVPVKKLHVMSLQYWGNHHYLGTYPTYSAIF